MLIVTGELLLPAEAALPDSVTFHAFVEDVSLADAASPIVGQVTINGARLSPDQPYGFEVSVDPVDPRRHYALRIHVDLGEQGRISVGDFISMQSYPVLTFGQPSQVQVQVHRVR